MHKRLLPYWIGVALLSAVSLAGAPLLVSGAVSSAVVTATIPSATQISTSGCPALAVGVTSFGNVMPGTSAVTSDDCVVNFGSSNDTSQLRIFQEDGSGRAFVHDGWSPQPSGTTSILHDVTAIDELNAIIVGTAGRILRTVDGGTSWSLQQVGTAALYDVALASPNVAWAVGANTTVLRTTDGVSWSAVGTTGIAAGVSINGVATTSPTNGWIVTDDGDIRYTGDGGTTWSVQRAATGTRLTSIVAVGPTELFAAGANGSIVHTTDGVTWTTSSVGVATQVRSIDAVDPQRLTVVGNNGMIRVTTDGGASWSAQTGGPPGVNLNRVTLLDAQRGYVVGDDGTLLETEDGGATWVAGSLVTTEDLESTDYVNGRAWIIGGNGSVYANPDLEVADLVDGVTDWDQGTTGAFGACLRSHGGTGIAPGWVVDANADCTAVDTDPWNVIPTSSAAAGALVSRGNSASATDLEVRLRFGFRATTDQAPGQYRARLSFLVLAPSS